MIPFSSVKQLIQVGFELFGNDKIECEKYLRRYRYLLLNQLTWEIWTPEKRDFEFVATCVPLGFKRSWKIANRPKEKG